MAGVVRGLMRCEVSICKLRIRAPLTNKQVVPWGFVCRGGMPVSSLPISLPALSAVSPWSTGFANLAVDPVRPKRPASAWMHFLSEFRKTNNGIPAKEVMTSASKSWKVMTVPQKKPFQEMYDVAKKVYDDTMKNMSKSGQKKARTRDPEKPKKPTSPFLLFLNGYRKQNESLKPTDASKLAAAIWNDMSKDQKQPYEKQYAEEKNKYDEALEQYKASTRKTTAKSGQKEARTRDPEKPKKPTSQFFLFLNGYRKKNESLKPTDASSLAAAIWNDMSKEQKQPYEKQYAEEKNKYDEALKLYKASGKEDVWREKTGKTTAGRQAKTAKKGK